MAIAPWTSPSFAAGTPTVQPDTATAAHARVDSRLRDDTLLLYEVTLDQLSLTDTIATYATDKGPLIPLGELARLLDVDLRVSPTERRVTGTIGTARRGILIDLDSRSARLPGGASALDPEDVAIGLTDIYVRPRLLEQILPVRVTVDDRALRIMLVAREPLPIQSRLDRLGRIRALLPETERHSELLSATAPWRAISPPAFDVALATGVDTNVRKVSRRYDIRAAADVLFTSFQGYLGSDERGRPATARALFERRDPDGLFGPLHITRASAGDVFTPALALGPRSTGGRGVSFSTTPLAQTSVFDRIDLRGELPIGYDVELYVNDVLRGGQQTPVEGRYEFLNVVLVRGTNVIRLVSYGPHGERSEEVRVINVGGGQLPRGTLVVDGGAVQQDRALFELDNRTASLLGGAGGGGPRIVANLAYGLSNRLTVVAGGALYDPDGLGNRTLGTVGVRTSLRGFATQIDVARDSANGGAFAVALAGRPLGLGLVVRHDEYQGRFIDETTPDGGGGAVLKRYSEVTMDLAARPFAAFVLPVTFSVQRAESRSGGVDTRGALRASAAVHGALLSVGLDYDHVTLPGSPSVQQLSGNVAASTNTVRGWQLRANLDYAVLPSPHVRDATLIADRAIGPAAAVRFGLGHSFEGRRDTRAQASATLHLPFGDASFDAGYGLPRHDWQVGLTFSFGLLFDPIRHRYDMRRSGAASGGNLALRAFVDRNGDGRYETGEETVAGVAVDGGFSRIVSGQDGEAIATGLSYAAPARVQVNLDNVDLPDVAGPPATIQFMPRAGRTVVVDYPLQPVGEVLVRLTMRQGGKPVGLSAVRVRIVGSGGVVAQQSTEYDGSVVFDRLRAGAYRVELDDEQARRLGMRLQTPLVFTVPANGGVVPDVRGELTFDAATTEKGG